MDVLVLTTMKNAAKCDTKSELQNPVNLYVFERMLRFRVLLEACLFECLFSPLAVSLLVTERETRGLWGWEASQRRLPAPKWRDDEDSIQHECRASQSTNVVICPLRRNKILTGRVHGTRRPPDRPSFCFLWQQKELNFRTSNQARGPAEFKHITKRRKRN